MGETRRISTSGDREPSQVALKSVARPSLAVVRPSLVFGVDVVDEQCLLARLFRTRMSRRVTHGGRLLQ